MIGFKIFSKIKRKFYSAPKEKYKYFKFYLNIGKLVHNKSFISSNVNIRDLVINHYDNNSNFLRMDTVIRYLAIEQYYGENNFGYELYNKMQTVRLKKKGTSSLNQFIQMLKSIDELGYSESSLITINQKGFLIDGSHRLAYAIFSGKTKLPIELVNGNYSVDYSINWFKDNGFSNNEIKIIENGFLRIKEKLEISFPIILWGSVADYFDEITSYLEKKFKILKTLEIDFKSETSYFNTIKSIYSVDSISNWKIEKKLNYLKEYPNKVKLISIDVQNPDFRYKYNKRMISRTMEIEKKAIRTLYKDKIPQYFYDIIVHAGDNYNHSKYIFDLMSGTIKLSNYFEQINKVTYFMTKKDVPYQCSDFPKSFCLGKDIDLLVTPTDYDKLRKLTLSFFNKYKDIYTIKILDTDKNCKVRLELESRLVILIDISLSIDGLPISFFESCFNNIVVDKDVKVLNQSYEYIIRKNGLNINPLKKYHTEFIEKVESDNSEKINDILLNNDELREIFQHYK